jgi:hypothetical protein
VGAQASCGSLLCGNLIVEVVALQAQLSDFPVLPGRLGGFCFLAGRGCWRGKICQLVLEFSNIIQGRLDVGIFIGVADAQIIQFLAGRGKLRFQVAPLFCLRGVWLCRSRPWDGARCRMAAEIGEFFIRRREFGFEIRQSGGD